MILSAPNERPPAVSDADLESVRREARHRLANVVQLLTSLVRLRARAAESDEAKAHLGWLLGAVTALGVSEKAASAGRMNLALYLEDIGRGWERTAGEKGGSLTLEVEPVELESARGSAVALCAYELVDQIRRHAPDAAVTVRLQPMRLEVVADRDWPQVQDKPGTGMALVRDLSRQAGATVLVEGGRVCLDLAPDRN